jgi:ATP synthase protein I
MAEDERRDPIARRGQSHKAGAMSSAMSAAGLGVQLVASILVCLYIGRWLDQRLGTGPWLLIVGVFVGAAAGFYTIYRTLVAAGPSGRTGRDGEHNGPRTGGAGKR